MATTKTASRFFTTKTSKGGSQFKNGVRLFLHGREIGSIAQGRETGLFAAFLVNGEVDEFKTFAEADLYAWTKGV